MSETTLIELLENSGARLRVLDMGRRVVKIDRNSFLQFEQTAVPWPAPLVRQAWFGMLMQNSDLPEPLIWFLRMPLDEQGKLVLASRDYFIHRLIEASQLNLDNESRDACQSVIDDSKKQPWGPELDRDPRASRGTLSKPGGVGADISR